MNYILRIGNMLPLKDDTDFDPVEFRTVVAETLILKSKNITNRCMYCFSEDHKYGKAEAE